MEEGRKEEEEIRSLPNPHSQQESVCVCVKGCRAKDVFGVETDTHSRDTEEEERERVGGHQKRL